jgi:hypothetical protein
MAINGLALGTNNISAQLATKLDVAGGKILQIVRATDSTNRSTTSTSFADVTGMSVTITPQKSTSSILVLTNFTANCTNLVSGYIMGIYALTDSDNVLLSGAQSGAFGHRNTATTNATYMEIVSPVQLIGYDSPATTSAVTYKLRFKAVIASNIINVANGGSSGQLLAIEVSA